MSDSKSPNMLEEESSRFQAWLIPLVDFSYQHTPYRPQNRSNNDDNPVFFGREKVGRKFLRVLQNNRSSSGSYLITGYRGTGKTSFVNKILEDYSKGVVPQRLPRGEYTVKEKKKLYKKGEAELEKHKASFGKYWGGYDDGVRHWTNTSFLRTFSLLIKERCKAILCVLSLILSILVPLLLTCFGLSLALNWRALFFVGGLFAVVAFVVLRLEKKHLYQILNLRWWKYTFLRPVIIIKLNLGNQQLAPTEVMLDIVSLLRDALKNNSGYLKLLPLFSFLFLPILVAFVVLSLFDNLTNLLSVFSSWYMTNKSVEQFVVWSFFVLVCLSVWGTIYAFICYIKTFSQQSVVKILNDICAKASATETKEWSIRNSFFGTKKQRVDIPLEARQIENLLLQALEKNRRIPVFFPRPEIIFVFDELDKISIPVAAEQSMVSDIEEPTPEQAVKHRKREVEVLLSQLKNLITTASCRFIFIGGRDMHDAYLADQGSPHHLYSSIFDGVFYVESFLTDSSDERDADVSSMIEQYVCRRLMSPMVAKYVLQKLIDKDSAFKNNQPLNYRLWTLDVYRAYIDYITRGVDGFGELEQLKYIKFISDFIYFLTYRSRGNPKKLGLLFEQFVWPLPKRSFQGGEVGYRKTGPVFPETRFALIMHRDHIYQIEMIASLYVLLHGDTSHLIRQYGDKLTLSAFSIFDYLLKFHNMAFGPRELEYMPEVIDVHRAPALTKIIELILKKLESIYLRKLNNGLFEYRYISAFHREVEYLSQRSEGDLAAFNFTLDESSEIKSHYITMLHGQVTASKEFSSEATGYSAPALYSTIGDLHMLDRDYEKALVAYRNALRLLEKGVEKLKPELDSVTGMPKSTYVPLTASVRALIIYIRVQLKVGLISEMRGHHDNAAAIYAQTHRTVIEIAQNIDLGATAIATDAELIELLYQPRIAQSFLHVKRAHSYKSLESLSEQSIAEYILLWDRNYLNGERLNKKITNSKATNAARFAKNAERKKGSKKEEEQLYDEAIKAQDPLRRKVFQKIKKQQDDEIGKLWANKKAGYSKYTPVLEKTIKSILKKDSIFSLAQYIQPKLIATFYLYQGQAFQVRSQYLHALDALGKGLSLTLDVATNSQKLPFKLVADLMINCAYSLSALAYHSVHKNIVSEPLENITQGMVKSNSPEERKRYERFSWKSIKNSPSDKYMQELILYLELLIDDKELGLSSFKSLKKTLNVNCFEKELGKSVDKIMHLGALGRIAFYLAHRAYVLAGEPLAAWLALWRVQYVGVYVLSYWELLGKDGAKDKMLKPEETKPEETKHLQEMLIPKHVNQYLIDYGHEMVDSAYRVNAIQLEKIWSSSIFEEKKLDKKLSKWIAPVWVKNAKVCESFWEFYLEDDLSKVDDVAFSINEIGAFPALTRVMAEFLKGRAYLIKLQRQYLINLPQGCDASVLGEWRFYKNLNPKDPKDPDFDSLWCKSFNFLTRAISDGIAFEGGVDLLMPPLGFAYFYLWRLLQYKKWIRTPYFFMLSVDGSKLIGVLNRVGGVGSLPGLHQAERLTLKKLSQGKIFWLDPSDSNALKKIEIFSIEDQSNSDEEFLYIKHLEGRETGDKHFSKKNKVKMHDLENDLKELAGILERYNKVVDNINACEGLVKNFGDDSSALKEIDNYLKCDNEFQGDKSRYLDIDHCRARAHQFLTQMIGRHRANKSYFDYVETRYYLQDDFADPNFQAGWACEYALLPVAENMLRQLESESPHMNG